MRNAIALSLAILFAASAGEQIADAQPGNNAATKRGKILQRIRAMRAWQLTNVLDLTEATAARLFPVLNRFDSQLIPMRKRGERLRKQLKQALNRKAPAATYNKLVTEIQNQHAAMHKWQLARFAAIRRVLSPRQAAIALVSLPEIESKIRHKIREAMEAKQRGVKDPFR